MTSPHLSVSLRHMRWRTRTGDWPGFLLMLAGLRILFLLAGLDPAEERVMAVLDPARLEWPRGPERPLYDREELYAGTAAEAIRMGVKLPLAAYRFMPYGSGSLLVSLAAVPLYALFGSSYLVFKILPLLTTLAGGLFWFLLVRAWLGRRASLLFGFLYALAPPVLVRTALIAKGDHAEAMAWIGGVLLLATRAALAGKDRAQTRWAAAAGAAAGLGIFVTYSTVPVTAAVAVTALAWTRGLPRRTWLAAAVGFAVGCVPWLATVRATGGQALAVYGRSLVAMQPIPVVLERVRVLANQGLWAGYDLPGGSAARVLAGLVWLAAVGVGCAYLVRSARRPFAFLVLVGTAAHLAAFCLLAPDSSSRYLVPGYPFFLLAVLYPWSGANAAGAGADPAPGVSPRPLSRRGLGLVAVLLLGLAAQVTVLARSTYPAVHAPFRGTDWPLLGEIVGQKLPPEQIQALPPSVRSPLWVGFGKRVLWGVDRSQWPQAAALAGVDESLVWEGIGIAWVERGNAAEAGPHLRTLPAGPRAALRRGLALYGEVLFARLVLEAPDRIGSFLAAFDPADRPTLALSLARTLAVMATQRPGSAGMLGRVAASQLSPEDLLRGMGWALCRGPSSKAGPSLWPTPPAPWAGLRGPGGLSASPAALVAGLADAYEQDLSTRDPRWLLGDRRGPLELAAELEATARPLDALRASLFYRAAGRAAAAALRDPTRSDAESTRPWPWESVLPPAFHEAFAEGLGHTAAGAEGGTQ